jgi:hypothetical protein
MLTKMMLPFETHKLFTDFNLPAVQRGKKSKALVAL